MGKSSESKDGGFFPYVMIYEDEERQKNADEIGQFPGNVPNPLTEVGSYGKRKLLAADGKFIFVVEVVV